ncbi:MAG: TetR/AcrR family transcriptional regulator [Saprospiraceae bacterium]
MAVTIQIRLNEKLYLRDPQDTKLGRKIIQHSIWLIDEIGFEDFTFKKLADRIGSTEASIYRYFENKHRLILYLLSWYWEWVKFQIEFHTANIPDPEQKLEIAIDTMLDSARPNPSIDFVDEATLHRIVIAEATKSYRTKMVDAENKQGFFLTYKALCRTLADILSEINPNYPYPRALASTLLEMSNDQVYFAEHLPSLTEISITDADLSPVKQLLKDFALNLLR